MLNKTQNEIYSKAKPFLKVHKNYDVSKLPKWVKRDINNARVFGYKNKCVILPNGRKYHLDNKLNDLDGREWTLYINSVFSTRYPTKGTESYAHEIRKIHPSPKPPQLMRDIIQFFTKEKELVFDCFAGVGGSLLGASMCNRKGIGIDLNKKYLEAYHRAAKELKLKECKTYVADSVSLLKNNKDMKNILRNKKISLMLIDPPYANMMSVHKTGGDLQKYGKKITSFTNSKFDLGNMNRDDFLNSLYDVIENALPYIKLHGHVVIFIKDMQPKGKRLNMLHSEIIYKLNEIKTLNYKGMKIWVDETTKPFPYGYPFSFVANQVHQYILIFRKEK